MAITRLNLYLNFDGTAGQAIELYERVLGAKVEFVQRFGEVAGMPTPPEHKDRVMHALLRIGEGVIMISDTPPGETVSGTGNSYVCLHLEDIADATARFDALSAGGTIQVPLQETFFAVRFGLVTDSYGTRWMFHCSK